MYDRPELRQAHDRLWRLVWLGLRDRGEDAPEQLTSGEGAFDWHSSDLLLSQTCGMPYRMGLHKTLTLVGTPDYGVEDCPPGHYRSAIIAREDNQASVEALMGQGRIAFNMAHSQSGFAALHDYGASLGIAIAPMVLTGAHRASALTVAEGRADVAALDAVSWRLMERYDDFAAALRVVAWTKPTPGLPLVTAFPEYQTLLFACFKAALVEMAEEDRQALGVQGLVAIPHAEYMAQAGSHG